MARKQRKAAPKAKGTARAAQAPRKRQPKALAGGGSGRAAVAAVPATPPPGALEQELLQLARGAASTLRKVLLTIVVLAALAGIGAGLWALRPIPSFSSEDVVAGSPFDVTFRVTNSDSWFTLANLRLYCVIAQVRASTIAPTIVEATNAPSTLEPGQSGTFTCPLRAALAPQDRDDAGIPQRAEIYFRSQYDIPLIGTFRWTENSPRFTLNTRLLPPRWTEKL